MPKVYITAAGMHLPNAPVSNDEIENHLGIIKNASSGLKTRILQQNGIHTRYYAMDTEQRTTDSVSGLANKAIDHCLSSAEVTAEEITLLSSATTQGDLPVPGFGSMVHGEGKLGRCEVVSHQSVCAAGMMAVKSAYLNILSGQHKYAIACAADMPSRFFKSTRFEKQKAANEAKPLSFETAFLRYMLSDGAGALLLSEEPNKNSLSLEIEWIESRSHAHLFEPCMFAGMNKEDARQSWLDYDSFSDADYDGAINLKQDLKIVNNIVPLGVQHLFDLIEEGKTDANSIDWLLCHYSSEYFKQPILDLLNKGGLKIPEEKWFTNLHSKGNTGSASIYIMLEELYNSGRLRAGDTLLCMVPESGRFITSFMQLKVVNPSGKANTYTISEDDSIRAPELHIESQDAIQQKLVRALTSVWVDFETQLRQVPVIRKIYNGTISIEDYKLLLLNLRQQVIDGSQWIARAASNVSMEYFDVRSSFITHSRDEHRDYQILEKNYINCGGTREELYSGQKNIGSEALSGYMFHKASQPNPFDLLGGMFIIEGLGNRLAGRWGRAIQEQLELKDDQVSFFIYHETSDSNDNHFERLEKAIDSPLLTGDIADRIIKTAKVVARLYTMQLSELGHY